jgi:hypothetical protein
MVGLDVVTRRRVTFDFPERKLYFRDSAGAATATRATTPAKSAPPQ